MWQLLGSACTRLPVACSRALLPTSRRALRSAIHSHSRRQQANLERTDSLPQYFAYLFSTLPPLLPAILPLLLVVDASSLRQRRMTRSIRRIPYSLPCRSRIPRYWSHEFASASISIISRHYRVRPSCCRIAVETASVWRMLNATDLGSHTAHTPAFQRRREAPGSPLPSSLQPRRPSGPRSPPRVEGTDGI